MKVKKNISLEDTVIEKAKIKAKAMGFDFSAYITYLINKDITGVIEVVETVEKVESKLENKVINSLDNILG